VKETVPDHSLKREKRKKEKLRASQVGERAVKPKSVGRGLGIGGGTLKRVKGGTGTC